MMNFCIRLKIIFYFNVKIYMTLVVLFMDPDLTIFLTIFLQQNMCHHFSGLFLNLCLKKIFEIDQSQMAHMHCQKFVKKMLLKELSPLFILQKRTTKLVVSPSV
ncbi:hypothetical protein V8G54_025341 [Vigna mungo]|uniref:Uncharacterized protein n=1 Tax=Vigna mungo TaxID=3915 RepID=A0AAQ3MYE0_VIGMU